MNGPKVNSLPTTLVTAWIAFGYMLENPSIRPVLALDSVRGSDNPDGAENQQERLMQRRLGYWFCRRRRMLLDRLHPQDGGLAEAATELAIR